LNQTFDNMYKFNRKLSKSQGLSTRLFAMCKYIV